MAARDMQRAKLYRAERLAFGGNGRDRGKDTLTVAQCQAFVDKVLKDKATLRLYHETVGRSDTLPAWVHFPVKVKDGGGMRCATAYKCALAIALPRWSRTPETMLHEVAHIVCPSTIRREAVAAHGPVFARILLTLIGRHMGEEEEKKLREQFVACGVSIVGFS